MRKQPFSRQSEEKRDFVLKIAIVDDLKLDAEQLSHLIFSYMKEHRIPTAAPEIFPNGKTFLASFTVGSFDIVFLDIYMDGLSGMETAQKLRTLDGFLPDRFCHYFAGFCGGQLRCERGFLSAETGYDGARFKGAGTMPSFRRRGGGFRSGSLPGNRASLASASDIVHRISEAADSGAHAGSEPT